MGLTGGLALGDTSSLLRELIGAALVQLPAIGALGAAVVAVVMFLPRWSVGLSWALVVLSIFVGPMFGPSLQLPTWLMDLSPFTYVPNAPAVAVSVAPVLGLALAAALLSTRGSPLTPSQRPCPSGLSRNRLGRYGARMPTKGL